MFDSLLRGYPIGSFLFWQIKPNNLRQYQFYRFMDRYHQRDHRHNEPLSVVGERPLTAVLDGQQRLTALNIGLKGYYATKVPWARWSTNGAFAERRLYLNLLGPQDKDSELAYEFKLLRPSDIDPENPDVWFPVNRVLEFESIDTAIDYCQDRGLTEKGQSYPRRTLVQLFRVVKEHPLINYYLEEEQDLDRVLNIFIRVNSGGTVLSYSDMLLSIASAQWQQRDARKEIHGLVDELNRLMDGMTFTKDFVLKASLVLADIQSIEFRVGSFTRDNMRTIEEHWDRIADALRLTVNLVASWGYNAQTLTSNNAIIPLAYYLDRKGSPKNFVESAGFRDDRSAMRRWLAISLLRRIFSGQPDGVLRPIRRILQANLDEFPADQIRSEFRATPRSMDFSQAELEGLLDYEYGDNYAFSILALLYPWLKYDQKFHIDHIFPRALFTPKTLAARGIPQSEWHLWLDHVNDLANLQLLQGIPNEEKSDKEFGTWLEAECPSPQALEAYRKNHLIPDVDLDFVNFPNFHSYREQLILTKLKEVLSVDGAG